MFNIFKAFSSLSVLQCVAEFVWICTLRGNHVPNSLGFVSNHIHRNSGPVFGCYVSQTGRKLGINDTSSNLQIGLNLHFTAPAN